MEYTITSESMSQDADHNSFCLVWVQAVCFVCPVMDVKSLCNNESQQNVPRWAPKLRSASDKYSQQMFKYVAA